MLINNKIRSEMNNYINTSNHVLLKPIEEQLYNNKSSKTKIKILRGLLTYAYQ